MYDLIDPKSVEIAGQDSVMRTFYIGRMPTPKALEIGSAVQALTGPTDPDGISIVVDIMSHVGVKLPPGDIHPLNSFDLVIEYCHDIPTVKTLLREIVAYNTDANSSFGQNVQTLIERI